MARKHTDLKNVIFCTLDQEIAVPSEANTQTTFVSGSVSDFPFFERYLKLLSVSNMCCISCLTCGGDRVPEVC